MAQSNDLTDFLKNTEKALRNNTVKELNAAVVHFLRNKDEKIEEAHLILQVVADEFSITKRVLQKSSARGKVETARKIAYCLLHFDLGLNTRYIAEKLFDRWVNSVSNGIKYYKSLDMKIKQDKEFMSTYERLQLKISTK